MTRIYAKEVECCGWQCPSYSCEPCCGGGDYQYCDLYKKEIFGNIIEKGFPTFCKLDHKLKTTLNIEMHTLSKNDKEDIIKTFRKVFPEMDD